MATERRSISWWRYLVVAVGLGVAIPTAGAAASANPTEYDVKAAFLFNFAKFVTWPPAAFPTPSAPVLIGVLGDNPFGNELARLAADLRVQGRTLEVVHATNPAQLRGCHVVFVSDSERERLRPVLLALRQMGAALTVGESDDFLDAGGMIHFVVRQNRVRFEIDAANAGSAGLVISSKLLTLAVNSRPVR